MVGVGKNCNRPFVLITVGNVWCGTETNQKSCNVLYFEASCKKRGRTGEKCGKCDTSQVHSGNGGCKEGVAFWLLRFLDFKKGDKGEPTRSFW